MTSFNGGTYMNSKKKRETRFPDILTLKITTKWNGVFLLSFIQRKISNMFFLKGNFYLVLIQGFLNQKFWMKGLRTFNNLLPDSVILNLMWNKSFFFIFDSIENK